MPFEAITSLIDSTSLGGTSMGLPSSGSVIDSFTWNTIVGLLRNAPGEGVNVTAAYAPFWIRYVPSACGSTSSPFAVTDASVIHSSAGTVSVTYSASREVSA